MREEDEGDSDNQFFTLFVSNRSCTLFIACWSGGGGGGLGGKGHPF